MPAKKTRPATKRKKTTAKKAVAKKTVKKKARKPATPARKKSAARKKTGASARKTAKKKVAVKKKSPARKKAAMRKKTVTKKKSVTKKKTVARKKTAAKKTVARKKPAAKKKAAVKKKLVATKKRPARKAAAKKKVAKRSRPRTTAKRRAQLLSGPIHGVAPYRRAAGEIYMSDEQLEHFQNILLNWKRELMEEVDRTVHHMKDEAANFPDPNDRATQESEFGLELRTRDRERKLLRKIDSALSRIEDGSYGYCEETGEEIGLKRLEARPVATLCLEAQERRELAEKQFRDRDDRYR